MWLKSFKIQLCKIYMVKSETMTQVKGHIYKIE